MKENDGDRGDEAGGADDREETDDAQAIRSCLDMTTLGSARAALNCTEVNGPYRNGWTGYTKVYEPGFARRGSKRFNNFHAGANTNPAAAR